MSLKLPVGQQTNPLSELNYPIVFCASGKENLITSFPAFFRSSVQLASEVGLDSARGAPCH